MNWVFWISRVPKNGLSFIIARSEDAVMVTIVTDILDLFFMVIEVAKRANSVVLLSGRNVPKGKVPIITASDNISIFIWVPLK